MTAPATPEKPAKWATFLSYFLVIGVGLIAWKSCGEDDKDGASKVSNTPAVPSVEAPRVEVKEEPAKPPEAPKQVKGYKLSAGALLAAYEENEVAADEKFKGAIVQVTGKIESVGKDFMGDPYVSIGTGKDFELTHIQAMFDRDTVKQLAGLRKGAEVSVQCTCEGKMMNVLLKDCSLKPGT